MPKLIPAAVRYPSDRRGRKPSRRSLTRKLGKKNWRKKGEERGEWGRRCHLLVRGDGRSSGRGLSAEQHYLNPGEDPQAVWCSLMLLGKRFPRIVTG
jgi:hypothetical protein